MSFLLRCFFLFFFNDTATTEIYTLSLHDALPIYGWSGVKKFYELKPDLVLLDLAMPDMDGIEAARLMSGSDRSEEHTSELQSPDHLVCRLLLEKKKAHNQQ